MMKLGKTVRIWQEMILLGSFKEFRFEIVTTYDLRGLAYCLRIIIFRMCGNVAIWYK